MISPEFVKTMARYNAWQNDSVYTAASNIGEEARQTERGAFFGSIHRTLCHLLWGDQIWMHRLHELKEPRVSSIPESGTMIENWDELTKERKIMDREFLNWSGVVTLQQLEGDFSWYSGAAGREVTRKMADVVVHVFNHQTHHRGQVHAMLTAADANPDDTDLFLMPQA